MNIKETIFSDPILSIALLAVLFVAVMVSRRYLGPRSDWIERARVTILPKLDRFSATIGVPMAKCTGVDGYVMTVRISEGEIERMFDEYGHSRSVANMFKFRHLPDGSRQYEITSWVYRETIFSKYQQDVYLFPSVVVEGGYDVYHHKEYNFLRSMRKHLTVSENGDPDKILRDVFSHYERYDPAELQTHLGKC